MYVGMDTLLANKKNFRLVEIECIYRRQIKWTKSDICLLKNLKHCGVRGKGWLPAFLQFQ